MQCARTRRSCRAGSTGRAKEVWSLCARTTTQPGKAADTRSKLAKGARGPAVELVQAQDVDSAAHHPPACATEARRSMALASARAPLRRPRQRSTRWWAVAAVGNRARSDGAVCGVACPTSVTRRWADAAQPRWLICATVTHIPLEHAQCKSRRGRPAAGVRQRRKQRRESRLRRWRDHPVQLHMCRAGARAIRAQVARRPQLCAAATRAPHGIHHWGVRSCVGGGRHAFKVEG